MNRGLLCGLWSCVLVIFCHNVSAQVPAGRDIHPRSYRQLRLQSGHYIRTPDDVYWNMWGEQEYLKVFNEVVARKPVKRRRSEGMFIEWVTVGHQWEVAQTREKEAWAVPDIRLPNTPPDFWDREIGGTPPLWWSSTADDFSFIYINEDEPDAVSRELDERATAVTAQLDDTTFRVELRRGRGFGKARRQLASRTRGDTLVRVDDPKRVVRDGYLNGEFILWPDPSIDIPPGLKGAIGTYRYIPVDQLRPTPEELAEAVDLGEAELVEWQYRRDRRNWRWVRSVVPIQYRNLAALRSRREARQNAAPPEPRDTRPPDGATHLLLLANGDYLYGKLLEENDRGVRFEVMIAGIAAERSFAPHEVARVAKVGTPEHDD